jgi:hypothetical protein
MCYMQIFMFGLHSDPIRGCVVAGVLYSQSELDPTKGLPYSIIHRLVATQFSQNHVLVQHLSGIYYVL